MKNFTLFILLLLQSSVFTFGQKDSSEPNDNSLLMYFNISKSDSINLEHSRSGRIPLSGDEIIKCKWSNHIIEWGRSHQTIAELYANFLPYLTCSKNYVFFSEEIVHLKHNDNKFRYNVEAKISNAVGDNAPSVLQKQLDLVFGLNSSLEEREVDVLVLKGVRETKSIKILKERGDEDNVKLIETPLFQPDLLKVKGIVQSNKLLAEILCFSVLVPVIVDNGDSDNTIYDVDISAEGMDGLSIDEIKETLEQEGLILEKGRAMIKCMQLQKAE